MGVGRGGVGGLENECHSNLVDAPLTDYSWSTKQNAEKATIDFNKEILRCNLNMLIEKAN